MSLVDAVLANRWRPNRIGKVLSVTPSEFTATVLVSDGEVDASFGDHVSSTIIVGAVCTLIPLGDTYEIISTRTGSSGSGGLVLGPELLPNNGFEYGGTRADHWFDYPWINGTASSGRDTTPGEALSGSARLVVNLSPGAVAPDLRAYSEVVAVDEGETYQASGWLKASTLEASLSCEIQIIAAPTVAGATIFGTGAVVVSAAIVTTPGAAYQFVTGPVTVPAGCHFATFYLRQSAATTTADLSVSWDEASLRQRITS